MRERATASIYFVPLLLILVVCGAECSSQAQEGVRVHITPMPYRNPTYRARCRVESRVSARRVESMTNKREARVRARARARAGDLDQLLLFAKMAFGEEGTPWPGRNDDGYEAMLAVLDFRRTFRLENGVPVARPHPISRVEIFAAYSPRRVFPHPTASVRNLWISELRLNGNRPPSWPRNRYARAAIYPTWRHYGCPRWLATIDNVREIFERSPENIGNGPCEETPHHWGGRPGTDDRRPHEGGWRHIDCGVTGDRFYVVPPEDSEDSS